MAHVHGTAGTAQMTHQAAKAMEHGMVNMMIKAPAQQMAKGAAATGAVVSASSSAARSFLGRLLNNPLVMFGIGIAVGYSVHKYRKDIIGAANRVAEKGKDFVLQQRESLEDIVAETRESDA